jgi:hypothetical protein
MRIAFFLVLFLFVAGCESKKLPPDEPNLPTVGSPPPPPGSMMDKKGGDYSKGINAKR